MGRYVECLKFTLQWEGGYVNDPDDPGGATNCGITQAVYDTWRAGQKQPKQPVRQISAGEVEAIYRRKYWDACGCDRLPAPLDLAVFDAAVNCGVSRAAKWLQRAVGVTEDGVIGPKTLAIAGECVPSDIAGKVAAARDAHYAAIIKANPKLAKFGKGWANRMKALREAMA